MKIRNTLVTILLAFLSLPVRPQTPADSPQTVVAAMEQDSTETDSIVPEFDTDPELTWQENITQRLDNIIQTCLPETVCAGIMVWDLTDNVCLYKYHERACLRPASTMKCITAIAALDLLGDDHRFTTRLYCTGELTDSTRTLAGDLYCVGGMDPMFNADDLTVFVDAVRQAGITTVSGNLYADLSFKDRDRLGSGWCWDDDNPVLSPLLVGRKDEFTAQFQRRLSEVGITINGATGERQLPSQARLLAICSRPISEVLRRMMKQSDNLCAESTFYQIAGAGGARWATLRQARQKIHALIRKIGLSPSDYHIADGSGLSLYNYVSPELEVKLLNYAYHTPSIYSAFLPTLPIAGVDGTLARRMRRTPAAGNVRAKTGTLMGVSSLAGYLTASNGHLVSFSILCNGGLSHTPMLRFQNRICVALCR